MIIGITGGTGAGKTTALCRLIQEYAEAGDTSLALTSIGRDGESRDLVTGKVTPIDLPTSNVLQFFTDHGNKVTVRPSGTEPKIKFYFGVKGELCCKERFDETNAALDAKIEAIKKSMKLS